MLCLIELPRIEHCATRQQAGWIRSYGKIGHAAFDFNVAVRAQQDALARFRPRCCQRPRNALAADLKALGRRVEVVELQRGRVPVIAADDTGAARLLDELHLQAAATLGDVVGSALGTAEAVVAPYVSRPAV